MSARITEAMVEALGRLVRLTKFELARNVAREPWKSALDKADTALAAALSTEADGWQMIAEGAPQPPHGVPVLLWSPPSLGHPDGHIEARPYSSGRSGPGWSEASYHGYATHWRPLPAAPLPEDTHHGR